MDIRRNGTQMKPEDPSVYWRHGPSTYSRAIFQTIITLKPRGGRKQKNYNTRLCACARWIVTNAKLFFLRRYGSRRLTLVFHAMHFALWRVILKLSRVRLRDSTKIAQRRWHSATCGMYSRPSVSHVSTMFGNVFRERVNIIIGSYGPIEKLTQVVTRNQRPSSVFAVIATVSVTVNDIVFPLPFWFCCYKYFRYYYNYVFVFALSLPLSLSSMTTLITNRY